jgi:hypothetical protein
MVHGVWHTEPIVILVRYGDLDERELIRRAVQAPGVAAFTQKIRSTLVA